MFFFEKSYRYLALMISIIFLISYRYNITDALLAKIPETNLNYRYDIEKYLRGLLLWELISLYAEYKLTDILKLHTRTDYHEEK